MPENEPLVFADVIFSSEVSGNLPPHQSELGVGTPTRSEQIVSKAQQAFKERGFEVGPLVGSSFSIAANSSRFADAFGVPVTIGPAGQPSAQGSAELPLQALKENLPDEVVTVVLSSPSEMHD